MQDIIQREILIQASQEAIYQAIADPDQVVKWFPETLEGEYKPDSQPIFGFGDHGKSRVYIVAAKPHTYFAYRWVPGTNQLTEDIQSVPNTLVEFIIPAANEGVCTVTLKETGFAALPAPMGEDAIKQNSGGWDFMLDRLETLFNQKQ